MFTAKVWRLQALVLIIIVLFTLPTLATAATLGDLFGKQEVDETEREETIERIQSVQEKLELLQDKLRALERRKAAKLAAQRAEEAKDVISATPVQINWTAVDETTTNPGEFGMYTYLLFKGELSNSAAIGILEDFILTIETLPENDIPPVLANRFLVPVERPQSLVSLGRQPYDFKLNETYLKRLGVPADLPNGPILVSMREPIDPYADDDVPLYLAVSLGHQTPERAAALARTWNQQEKNPVADAEHPVSKLFWQIIDGAGPTRVQRNQQRITVSLPNG
jgi:hypothetical protein